MSVLDRARALFERGAAAQAATEVKAAADADDAEALNLLASWRLFGTVVPRDLDAAHAGLDRAAALGHVEAARTRAFLIANGTGCAADFDAARAMMERIADADRYAALQLAFLLRMKTPEAVAAAAREILSESPSIVLIRSLLLPEECRYLMSMAAPHLQPSLVIDTTTGERIPNPIRTSFGMSFGPTLEDLVVNTINRRIADATGTGVGWGEPLHMLRYRPGEEYRPHVDALPGERNQRVWTALVYLNHDYQGGETAFPELGFKVRGGTGDVLVFGNVLEDGRGDMRTLHAGLAVTAGEKWLATRWIRQRDYHPWLT
ncbi:MAG: 2OG-Fe(II) oxygenase [Sphingomonas sp.]|nr:2OG-Fe(II) oxygenase [Sphingomonas sp.]